MKDTIYIVRSPHFKDIYPFKNKEAARQFVACDKKWRRNGTIGFHNYEIEEHTLGDKKLAKAVRKQPTLYAFAINKDDMGVFHMNGYDIVFEYEADVYYKTVMNTPHHPDYLVFLTENNPKEAIVKAQEHAEEFGKKGE